MQHSAAELRWAAELKLLREKLERSEARAAMAAEGTESRSTPNREADRAEAEQAKGRADAAEADAATLRLELEGERQAARLAEQRLAEEQERQAERVSQEKESADMARLRAEAAEATALDALKARDESLSRAEHAEAEVEGLRERLSSMTSAGSGVGASSGGADAELVRQLQKELAVMSEEVREARLVKDRAQHSELLREKLRAAEGRVARLEGALRETEAATERMGNLEEEVEGWRRCLAQVPDVEKPEDVADQMLRLQERSLVAAERRGQLEAEVAGLRAQLDGRDAASRERRASPGGTEAAGGCNALVLVLQQENRRCATEVEGLKRVINSYEKEIEAILEGRAHQGGAGAADGAGSGAAREHRFREAETALALAKEQALSAQNSLAQVTEEGHARAKDLNRCHSQIGELEARLAAAGADLECAGKEIGLLNQRLGAGRFDPATTKVLHFTRNPETMAREEAAANKVSALESENASLRQAVQRLEEGSARCGGSMGGGSARQPGEANQVALKEAELTILQRKLTSQEKMASRLKQAFQERVKTFRGACVALFGYKVEMAASRHDEGTTFTLTPAGALGDAEAESSQLVFNYGENGRAELVPNAFSAGMQREVDAYLGRFHSVPAFTANLTMDLFQRHTSAMG